MDMSHLMGTATTVIPLASIAASAVNHYIRDAQAKGETLPEWLVKAAAVLNVVACNLDKSMALYKLLKPAKAEEVK